MFVEFSTEQKMVQKMVREFAEKEVAPLNQEMDREGFPHKLFDKMKENGFLGIHFPEKYKGGDGDAVTSALTIYELAKASASVALALDAHWLAADTILAHGSEEQKQKYLARAATDTIFAFSLTEPCAGSDAAGIQTVAEQSGDGYVLNGTKAWCTNGGVSGVYVILAKTDKTKGAKGISAFIVEESNPGLKVGKKEDKMGMRGSQTTELILDDCKVGHDALLGREGDGFKIAMMALDGARISIGAIGAGLSETALKVSKEYAAQRQAFGGPIANLQAIQFKIAEMAIGIEAIKLMTFDVARMKAAGMRHTKEAAMVKVFAGDHSVKCALEAIQIHGGYGYSREYLPELLLRDAKLLQIGEGATEVLLMLIGRTELATK
ncbi:MAG: acyl-CoA dehydrogenase family protein [Synergistaceae bacterium]|jgi:alkylation response protein AidB-like acyl-CoA dehydrogenase|nr:acyl-CoA dehydrogenase family protein [Synergistaceae bacterium]